MSNAPLFPTGGFLSGNRYSSHATAARVDDVAAASGKARTARRKARMTPPDPLEDEPHYPAWKVTLFVILFCTAFWGGIAYVAAILFG